MRITQGVEFAKEFKKLKKKYPSLTEDLAVLERVIEKYPFGEDSRHCNALRREVDRCVCKRRMMCRSVRGSEFRVIYYYDGKILELQYIEIYYKGSKETEDKKRVEVVWKKKNK
ncbi:MAG: hypothetical protein QMC23_12010 [Rubritalea sp.]|jgi:hypothetical protein|tara:strand:- start:230 stop:571 length:342 start_codon:yes stop_codon:yes gene_type:complete